MVIDWAREVGGWWSEGEAEWDGCREERGDGLHGCEEERDVKKKMGDTINVATSQRDIKLKSFGSTWRPV